MTSDFSPVDISIGILAHNSTSTIRATLQSLCDQSLLHTEAYERIRLSIVSNGSTDDTAEISREVLSLQSFPKNVSWQVHEIVRAGKSNAWNEFVHNYSGKADILIFMDSDITFLGPDTLAILIQSLREDETAIIAVDEAVKDVALKPRRSFLEWLSLMVSNSSKSENSSSICGQLYAGKADFLRKIWLPTTLPVEDGFLRAMVVTKRFQEPECAERVVRVPDARHSFEAHLQLSKLLSHEEWLIASSTINTYVYDFLWDSGKHGKDAGQVIRELNEKDPNWLQKMIAERTSNHRFWLVPSHFVFRRFARLRQFPLPKQITRFPFSLAAFCFDLWVCTRVNYRLKRHKNVAYWRDETPSALS